MTATCPICGSADTEHECGTYAYHVYSCYACGTVWRVVGHDSTEIILKGETK